MVYGCNLVYLALARGAACGWMTSVHWPIASVATGWHKEKYVGEKNFLDFEQPIAELESKIEELRYVQTESAVDISEEIDQLSKKPAAD